MSANRNREVMLFIWDPTNKLTLATSPAENWSWSFRMLKFLHGRLWGKEDSLRHRFFATFGIRRGTTIRTHT